jgi:hypothetical protein
MLFCDFYRLLFTSCPNFFPFFASCATSGKLVLRVELLRLISSFSTPLSASFHRRSRVGPSLAQLFLKLNDAIAHPPDGVTDCCGSGSAEEGRSGRSGEQDEGLDDYVIIPPR